MPKVLKNCKILPEKYDEFNFIKIRYEDEVFVDLPMCTIEFGQVLEKPVLYLTGNTMPQAIELSELVTLLGKLKKFYLAVNDKGKLFEVEPDKALLNVRLPKDTNLDELMLVNGQIIRETPAPKEEVK